MTDFCNESSKLDPLLPDLIGELFVLDHFNFEKISLQEKFDQCIKRALEFEKQSEIISFFTKCASDYPSHNSLECLRIPFGKSLSDSLVWSKTIVNLLYYIKDFELAQNLFSSLKNETDRRIKEDNNYPILLQLALYNFIKNHSDNSALEISQKAYLFNQNNIIKDNTEENIYLPDKVNVSTILSEQENLVVETVNLPRLKTTVWAKNYVVPLGDSIESLISKFADKLDSTFQNLLSTSYLHQELYLLEDLKTDEVFLIHDKFYLLIKNNGTRASTMKYLTATKNIVGVLHNFNQIKNPIDKRLNIAKKYFEQLINVEDSIRNSKPFIIEFSEFVSAIILFVKHNKNEAWNYYKILDNLFKQSPKSVSPKIMFEISRSAVNLGSGFKTVEEFQEFKSRLKEIEMYVSLHNIDGIKEMLGMTYGNLVNHNSSKIISNELKEEYYNKHIKLCFDNITDIKIAKGLLRGITTKHQNLLNVGDFNSAKKYFATIEKIYGFHSDDFHISSNMLNSINVGFEFSEKETDIENLKYYAQHYVSYLPSFIDNNMVLKNTQLMFGKIEGLKNGNMGDAVSKLYIEILKQICLNHGQHKSFSWICNHYSLNNY